MAYDNLFTITAVEDVAAGLLRVAEQRVCGIVHLAANPPVSRTQLADWIIGCSRRASEMSYKRVPVSALPMVRAPQAWLRSERAAGLGLTFAEPRSVVERKLALLEPHARMAYDNLFTITAVEDVAVGLLRAAEQRTCGVLHLAANPPVSRTQLADWIIGSSRQSHRMSYKRVPVSALPIVRAPQAWLRSEHAAGLGLTFAEPRSVVERKVAMLDEQQEKTR